MQKSTVRTMWTGGMFVVAGICLAIMVLVMLGCGNATVEPAAPEYTDAQPREPIEDDIPESSPEDDAAAMELLAPFRGNAREIRFDGELFDRPKAQARGLVEKAAYPALTGWAFDGRLQFQNGRFDAGETAPEGDHCTYFGLSCSDDWRAQLKFLVLDDAGFARNFRGSCGSAQIQPEDGLSNFWMPCANAYLTASEMDLTYYYDGDSCKRVSGSDRAKRIIGDAAASWANYMSRYSPVSFTQTANPNFANIYIMCATTLAEETMGMWTPNGNFTLRYGGTVAGYTPGGDELSATTIESCETRGLPGAGAGVSYGQGLDLMYSYDYGTVFLNYEAMFSKLGECSTTESQLTRGVRNTIVHESGHHFGFSHDEWDSLDTGIMRPSGIVCEDMADHSMGFSDNHLQALASMDMNGQGQGGELELWDVDMSCFIPSGYDDPRGPTLGGGPGFP